MSPGDAKKKGGNGPRPATVSIGPIARSARYPPPPRRAAPHPGPGGRHRGSGRSPQRGGGREPDPSGTTLQRMTKGAGNSVTFAVTPQRRRVQRVGEGNPQGLRPGPRGGAPYRQGDGVPQGVKTGKATASRWKESLPAVPPGGRRRDVLDALGNSVEDRRGESDSDAHPRDALWRDIRRSGPPSELAGSWRRRGWRCSGTRRWYSGSRSTAEPLGTTLIP